MVAADAQPGYSASDLTGSDRAADDERVRRSLSAVAATVLLAIAGAPPAGAEPPWFAAAVGPATQVLSVVGTGGSNAKMDVWQRRPEGWQPIGTAIPVRIGANGMVAKAQEGMMATPMGVFTLDFAFGTEPNPGGGLDYVQTTPDHWWSADGPTYNTMQVCKKDQCPFNTSPASGTENLYIPQYAHAVVMGVNKQRIPGDGSAFFVHSTDGGPTAGCVALDDATLVTIIRWLQPGAVIAIAR